MELEKNTSKTIITDSLKTAEISVPEGTKLEYIAFLQKGWKERQKLEFKLEGDNSSVIFLAIIIGTNEEEFPFETVSTHTGKGTKADYRVRGVLFDKSCVDYIGNLKIKPIARLTNSHLAHHTLMLSDQASTNTIPSLEIEADDVKAGHAATIGKVDKETLYYLQTRGIDEKTATEMLIKGFMEKDLKKISDEKIRNSLSEEIEKCLIQKR